MNKLHIELTNRCTLACPACPRTTWKELVKRPVDKADLDIDEFAKFLDCPGGRQIDTFVLCGDYGDAIYYPELFDFIKRFRATHKFQLHTNGSHRDETFWNSLNGLLTEKDRVIFAIDGLEDTNHLYRRNSNWSSIMQGIDIMVQGPARVSWQTIIFSFNHDQIDKIKEIAESKGADFFTLVTHRYGDDTLIPPEQYIETKHLFRQEYNDRDIEVKPGCMKEKVITCDGYMLPCDWIRNPRTLYKSQLWKQKDRWINKLRIKDINYDQALHVIEDWAKYVMQNSITGGPVDVLCKMKCRKSLTDDSSS